MARLTSRQITSAQSIIEELNHTPRLNGRPINWKGFAVSFFTDVISRDLPDTPSSTPEAGPKHYLPPSLYRLLRRINHWHRNRADVAALCLMTEHDLRDMGLNRLDVEAISKGVYRLDM
jgi:uncharacterized protein YjiS (DUF1127 family)